MKTCSAEKCNNKYLAKGYCCFHYHRDRKHIPFNRPFGNKGENNPRWSGGKDKYSYENHHLMKKNRLIKIKQQKKGKCEICGGNGKHVHHKDDNKTNHSLDNLILLCQKCHGRLHKGRKNSTSIWIRRYGFTQETLCKKLSCCYQTLRDWHKSGWINFFLGRT